LLTEDPSFKGRERGKRKRETLSPDRFSLYSSLASISGGITIYTTNKDIHKVSAIVEDTTTSSKVQSTGNTRGPKDHNICLFQKLYKVLSGF